MMVSGQVKPLASNQYNAQVTVQNKVARGTTPRDASVQTNCKGKPVRSFYPNIMGSKSGCMDASKSCVCIAKNSNGICTDVKCTWNIDDKYCGGGDSHMKLRMTYSCAGDAYKENVLDDVTFVTASDTATRSTSTSDAKTELSVEAECPSSNYRIVDTFYDIDSESQCSDRLTECECTSGPELNNCKKVKCKWALEANTSSSECNNATPTGTVSLQCSKPPMWEGLSLMTTNNAPTTRSSSSPIIRSATMSCDGATIDAVFPYISSSDPKCDDFVRECDCTEVSAFGQCLSVSCSYTIGQATSKECTGNPTINVRVQCGNDFVGSDYDFIWRPFIPDHGSTTFKFEIDHSTASNSYIQKRVMAIEQVQWDYTKQPLDRIEPCIQVYDNLYNVKTICDHSYFDKNHHSYVYVRQDAYMWYEPK